MAGDPPKGRGKVGRLPIWGLGLQASGIRVADSTSAKVSCNQLIGLELVLARAHLDRTVKKATRQSQASLAAGLSQCLRLVVLLL